MAVARANLRRAALQPARGDRHEQRQRARPRVVRRLRHAARPGVDAARRRRRAVRDDGVEQGQGVRRAHRARSCGSSTPRCRGEWGVRRVLRRRQSRRRRSGTARVYVGTIDGRLLALDAATGTRLGSRHARPARHRLHDHRRAARREGQGHHRQRRRRVRRARLRLGLRRRDRRAGVALVHRARRPEPRLRERQMARPRRPGTASGGASAAAAPSGIRWPTIPSSISSTSAPATARRGTAALRSPGGGDNLFLSSIVALDPDDGSYVWHYQTTPGESWDYTATQPIIVADLDDRRRAAARRHAGAEERLLLRARRGNGPASLGETRSRPSTGRRRRSWRRAGPSRTRPRATTKRGAFRGAATVPDGAHNWHPMAFSPLTGLVYIPVHVREFRFR